jgi:diketogulonate reductase-like aldo/keto reductase
VNAEIPALRLPDGEPVPRLGQGTWRMGEDASARGAEAAALRSGVELGMTLIDTAEMYGDGGAETLLGEALRGLREQVFLVSKVYPQNAGGAALRRACENSLKRLATDRIDLYLLHWRGGVALKATIDGMRSLQREGKIRHWGVSNFDADDMDELVEAGGTDCAVNQILYKAPLRELARIYQATPFQIALAWVLRRSDVMAIPKAATIEHVAANRRALDIALDAEALAALDKAFPPPRRKVPLAMI